MPLGAAALPWDALLVPLREARGLSPKALPRPAALPWQGMTLGQQPPFAPWEALRLRGRARPGGEAAGSGFWLSCEDFSSSRGVASAWPEARGCPPCP